MLRLRIGLWVLGGIIITLAPAPALELEYVGEQTVPKGVEIQGSRIGGLSGITYDPKRGLYLIASDTKDRDDSRIFLAKIPTSDSGIGKIEWRGGVTLKKSDKSPLPAVDAEGIALENRGRFFVSYEGTKTIPSGIGCFGRKSGDQLFELPLPRAFVSGEQTGMQRNHGLESLSTAGASRQWLFTTSESPLHQDTKPGLDPYRGPLRLLRYHVKARPIAEPEQRAYVMESDAVYTSVPDLLALDDRTLLVLERQLINSLPPRSRRIRIFQVDFDQAGATDAATLNSLRGQTIQPLKKKLLFDSNRAAIPHLDNIEALCLGPALGPDRSVVLVSDDNFNKTQQTQFLLLRLRD